MKHHVLESRRPRLAKGGLGAFAGVFTPSILTILGIILFVRVAHVVGNAGSGRALLIIGLANIMSVPTSVSLSAIATNLKVEGGGDYYLISRTLGVEFGGAVGIVLFLAQSVSMAFYCIGFGEAAASMLSGGAGVLPQTIGVLAVGISIIVYFGAAVVFAAGIAFATIGLGKLNVIAPVVPRSF